MGSLCRNKECLPEDVILLHQLIQDVTCTTYPAPGVAAEFVEDLHQLLVSLSKEILDTVNTDSECQDCFKRQSKSNRQKLLDKSKKHVEKYSHLVFREHLEYLRHRYQDPHPDTPDDMSMPSPSSRGLVGVTPELFHARKNQLTAFYERLEPSKVDEVRNILTKYR